MSTFPFLLILWFHITTGALALISGVFTLLFTAKGSRQHIQVGLVFWYLMIAMSASGIFLALLSPNAVFVFIAALSLYLINTGRNALTRRAGLVDGRTKFWLGIVICCFVAGLAIGIWAVINDTQAFGSDYILYFAMAFDALIFIILDWRLIRAGSATGNSRIIDHLWRMIGALFFGSFALFVANPQLFPDWFTDTGLSLLPELILLVILAYWILAVRSGRWQNIRATPVDS